jgi:hypothetical protein
MDTPRGVTAPHREAPGESIIVQHAEPLGKTLVIAAPTGLAVVRVGSHRAIAGVGAFGIALMVLATADKCDSGVKAFIVR